jgi:hypothetical protein
VFQDGLDDLLVFNEGQDPHNSPPLWTGQGIDFVDFLNEPGPVLPIFFRTLIRFQDGGNPVLFPFRAIPGTHHLISFDTSREMA